MYQLVDYKGKALSYLAQVWFLFCTKIMALFKNVLGKDDGIQETTRLYIDHILEEINKKGLVHGKWHIPKSESGVVCVVELVGGGAISRGEWYCGRRCSLVKKEKRLQPC